MPRLMCDLQDPNVPCPTCGHRDIRHFVWLGRHRDGKEASIICADCEPVRISLRKSGGYWIVSYLHREADTPFRSYQQQYYVSHQEAFGVVCWLVGEGYPPVRLVDVPVLS